MFVADRATLLNSLDKASSVVSNSTVNPALECVLLQLADSELSITGSNSQVQVTARCAVAPEKQSGSKPAKSKSADTGIAVSARKFSNILRSIDTEKVAIELKGNDIVITSDTSHFELAFQPGKEFPQIVSSGSDSLSAMLDQAELLRAIRRIQAAVSTKIHRIFLAGAYFDFSPDGLQLVATDGHRLATDLLTAKTKNKITAGFIVPRKAVQEIGNIIGDAEGETLRLGAFKDGDVFRSVYFETPNVRLIAQLIVAQYPDYRRVIPDQDKNNQHLVFDRQELLSGVRQGLHGPRPQRRSSQA